MIAQLVCLPLRGNMFLKTLTHFRSNISILAQSNATNDNAPSQNLFAHFVTTRFNMSLAEVVKILKKRPSLERLKTLDKVEQLVYMLNRYGCTEDQIANVIRSQPSLLSTSVERVLEPKIQVLEDLGVERENIAKILTWNPNILASKLEITRSNIELLKTVFATQDILIRAISKDSRILTSSPKALKSSISFWEDFGFRGIELAKFVLLNPRVLLRCSLTPEQLDLIRKSDIHKEGKMYKYIVNLVASSRIQVLESKIDNLQLCGLSHEEVWALVRAGPTVLAMSEESIKKKMDFMLNHMGLSVDFVAKHPRMLATSLDKVIRPRFLVFQNLTAMNGLEKFSPTRLCSIFRMTGAKFVAQIIQGHPESASLWALYQNAIADASKS